MDTKNLITFRTIVEQGNFKLAAYKLNYAQSTVTSQIQQLEEELKVQLFERIGREMRLTRAGKDLLPSIESILQSVDFIKSYHGENSTLGGSLQIALPETLLTYRIQPVLEQFRKFAPDVNLSLQAMNCYDIKDAVESGNIELGIHYNVARYGNCIVSKPIERFSLVLVGNARFDLNTYDFEKSNQKIDLCFITDDKKSIYQKKLESYLNQRKIVISGLMEVGSIEAMKRSVMSNLGIAFLPRFTVEEELKQGLLKEIPIELSDNYLTAVHIHHKNKWVSPSMICFMDLLGKGF